MAEVRLRFDLFKCLCHKCQMIFQSVLYIVLRISNIFNIIGINLYNIVYNIYVFTISFIEKSLLNCIFILNKSWVCGSQAPFYFSFKNES